MSVVCIPPYVETDVGLTIRSPLSRSQRAMHALLDGVRFGYPLCCVEEFVSDILEGRHPSVRRGSVPLGERDAVYVPCSRCCEEMGRVFIP